MWIHVDEIYIYIYIIYYIYYIIYICILIKYDWYKHTNCVLYSCIYTYTYIILLSKVMYIIKCIYTCVLWMYNSITPLYHSQCNSNRDHPSTGRMERLEKCLSLAQLKRICSLGKTNNLGKDPQVLYCTLLGLSLHHGGFISWSPRETANL